MPKYVVRYGIMRSLGVLAVRGGNTSFRRGESVVARTKRGLEIGEVLCEANKSALQHMKNPDHGEILRRASSNDLNELAHMQSQEASEFEACQQFVKNLNLKMELVDLEHVFGGERIIIYYLAEDRVDFRDLIRQLAKEFQTRIEMRQIGVRDEARLLADYGDCGKPVCCNTHLTSMPPVSMKMAKLQRATLDPTKISGRCGRLKCCLRYEYDTYLVLQKEMPRVGAKVETSNGPAEVLAQEIIAGQLLVMTEDRRRVTIPLSDVTSIIDDGQRKPSREPSQTPMKETTSAKQGDASGKEGPSDQRDKRDPKARPTGGKTPGENQDQTAQQRPADGEQE